MKENPYIITKVSVADSLRAIPVGMAVTYSARDFCCYSSAAAAISRLNAIKPESYRLSTNDNGITFTVSHLK